MTEYRIETTFTRLSDGVRFGDHVVEFDTETTPRSFVLDRLKSIPVVVLRTICHLENIPTESDVGKIPLADPRLKGLEKKDEGEPVRKYWTGEDYPATLDAGSGTPQ